MKEERLLEKEQAVRDVAEKMQRAQSMVIVDYRGLTVDEVSKLRSEFRNAGVEYRVIKNNMLRRAAESLGIAGMDDLFRGPSAVAFGYEDAVAPAKIMCKFQKDVQKTEIKGGVLSGKKVDQAEIVSLSKLPGKEELLAKMLGSLNAPITKFALALAAVPKGLAVALGAVAEKKEKDPDAFADVKVPAEAAPEAAPAEEASAAPEAAAAEAVPAAEESAAAAEEAPKEETPAE